MNSNNLINKIALVTGASRGIGKAIALALADEGINVAVNYYRQKEKAEEVCKLINEKGMNAVAVQADVSDAEAVKGMIATVENKIGEISILINNAGIAVRKNIEETTERDFDEAIKNNLKSSFLVTQAVLPKMRQNKWGRIVMVSSTAAQIGGVIGLHYAASKAGQIGMMHFYASRLSEEGITVNAIAPGLIKTDMFNELNNPDPAMVPVGRFGSPEEIAKVVIMLLINGYITNQTINVNGGIYPS
ncbi:MAG: SDR family NAD(P)-dependent oxidoreductase [Ignavibacteriaceae bacterium]